MLIRTPPRTPIWASAFHNIFRRSFSQYSNLSPIPQSKHYDLSSFKAYAEASGLDPESTVYRGTVYEYIVSEALHRKNMDLKRCGGRADKGIDLRGLWHIPLPPSLSPSPDASTEASRDAKANPEAIADSTANAKPESSKTVVYKPPSLYLSEVPETSENATPTKVLPVLVQCKLNTTSPLKVSLVRELIGTLACCQSNTIGLLASMYPCTNGARDAIRFSRKPMGYVCISEEGVVQQFVWNRIASGLIGSGLSVGVKYVNPPEEGNNSNITGERLAQEAVLMYDGKVVDGLLFKPVEVITPEKKKKGKKAKKEKKEKKEKKDGTEKTEKLKKAKKLKNIEAE